MLLLKEAIIKEKGKVTHFLEEVNFGAGGGAHCTLRKLLEAKSSRLQFFDRTWFRTVQCGTCDLSLRNKLYLKKHHPIPSSCSTTRQDDTKSQILLGRPAGGPYILIFGRVPLPQFHIA